MKEKKRVEVLGAPVDALVKSEVLEYVEGMIVGRNRRGAILAVNPEKVVRSGREPRLKDVLRRAELLIADGVGLVLASKILGLGNIGRVAGCDLMLDICGIAEKNNKSIFLFGASKEVNLLAQEKLRAMFPSLRIVGGQHGFPGKDGVDGVGEVIEANKPDVVFVALGSPAQEDWINENCERFDSVRIWQGVGGSFDVLAGKVKRAPAMWRAAGFEWLYRLLDDPRRLRRQVSLVKFVGMVIRHRFLPVG